MHRLSLFLFSCQAIRINSASDDIDLFMMFAGHGCAQEEAGRAGGSEEARRGGGRAYQGPAERVSRIRARRARVPQREACRGARHTDAGLSRAASRKPCKMAACAPRASAAAAARGVAWSVRGGGAGAAAGRWAAAGGLAWTQQMRGCAGGMHSTEPLR
jgi:hypothetical protein